MLCQMSLSYKATSEEAVFEKLLNILNGRQVDIVISDMAPIHQVIGLLINLDRFTCVNLL